MQNTKDKIRVRREAVVTIIYYLKTVTTLSFHPLDGNSTQFIYTEANSIFLEVDFIC